MSKGIKSRKPIAHLSFTIGKLTALGLECMTPEIDFFLKVNNQDWRLGYEEGFNQAKEIMILRFEKALKEIKKETPFTEATTTATISIN